MRLLNTECSIVLQWNIPLQRTPLETKILLLIVRCHLHRSFRYISAGVVHVCNQAVEYNVAVFSELSFAVRWLGMPSSG